MNPDQIIAILDTLTAADLRKVGAKVDELRSLYDAWQQPSDLGAASGAGSGVRTYRQAYVRCKKPTCTRCVAAPGHGPYWYVYWREGGKLRKQYIGKQRPCGGYIAHPRR